MKMIPRFHWLTAAKKPLLSLTALMLALSLTACGSDGSSSNQAGSGLSEMRVTVVPGVGSLPFRVALEKGYFRENGLNVTVTEGFDFASYFAALDRQFDAVMVVPQVSVPAAAAGLPIQAYAGMESLTKDIRVNPLITNKPNLDTLEDMANAGATIGVLRPGDFRTAIFKSALQGTGADPARIKQVAVPFPDAMAQLEAGRVDAIEGAAGFYEPLLDKGYKVVASLPQDAVVNAGGKLSTTYAHFVSTTRFMKESSDQVKAFQTSIEQAETWIDANKAEAMTIFAKWVGRDPSTVTSIQVPAWKAQVTQNDLQPWADLLAGGGVIKESFDASKMIADGK